MSINAISVTKARMTMAFITRLRVVGFFAAAVLFVALIALPLFYRHINRVFEIEVDAIMAKCNSEWEVTAQFSQAGYDLLTKPYISGLQIKQNKSQGFVPVVKIPRISFSYRVTLGARPHLVITQIDLNRPEVLFTLDSIPQDKDPQILVHQSKQALKGLFEKLSQFHRSLSSDFVSLAPDVRVTWNDALVKITDRISEEPYQAVQHSFEGLSGTSTFFLPQQEIQVVVSSTRHPEQKIIAALNKQNDDFVLKLKAEQIILNEFARYLPDVVKTTGQSSLSGKLSMAPIDLSQSSHILFDFSIQKIGLEHWRLADQELSDLSFKTKGDLDWLASEQKVRVHKTSLARDDVTLSFVGDLEYGAKKSINTTLTLESTPIQKLLNALPKEFIPVIKGAKVAGDISVKVDVALDMARPRDMVFEPKINILGFDLVRAPEMADVLKLKQAFEHTVRLSGTDEKTFAVGPQNRQFVSYGRLGNNIIKGVLTCEDGSFFRHEGFQLKHIRESIIQNIKEKRFVRGASTITMQLAKNLFLSGQKTLSRKFQEMLIAYALEQELDKKRLLEIYMNVIEWGPGIYGVGQASRHYFHKAPAQLSVLEAAYLGSIIANPKKYYYMYRRGEVTDYWADYLRVIVSKMSLAGAALEDVLLDDSYKPRFGWVASKI
ncbi:MAG TPA: biosynthetic peptidoglycan transglycosylase [bacterium]|nr:biosynthetic peptidoglycan transglycosylase [bacterium]